MPIIEPPNAELPLNQGDVLSGIKLYVTKSIESAGGKDTAQHGELCMVLSRTCVAGHKKTVVVAAVDKYPISTPSGLDSFDKVHEFLKRTRDGHGTPDLFYLAQLPGKEGKFCARFDAIFTVQIPEEAKAREQFLRDRRIGILSVDFQRDLHSRLFGAFASLGFDDHNWFSTDDLNVLVTRGVAELRELEAKEADLVAVDAGHTMDSKQAPKSLATDLEKIRKKIRELKDKVDPLQEVLNNRRRPLVVTSANA